MASLRRTALCLVDALRLIPLSIKSRSSRRPSTEQAASVTLRFVSWKPDHPRVWDEAIARFTAIYPRISVVRELAPHSSTAYHDLLTQKLKNHDRSVDVFFMDVVWVPEFAAAGWVRPLDEVFSSRLRADFLSSTVELGRYGDRIYGVPSRIDAGLLYYRQDLLAKYGFSPPTTWAELAEQANQILAGERPAQPALHAYSAQFKQYEGLVCNMLEFIEGNGGHLLAEDGRRSRLSAPETLAAVRFVREQVVGRLASRAVLTYQEPESLARFLQGQAIFHRNWPYAWDLANDRARSSIAGQVGVAPLPVMSGGRRAAALGGWLYGVSAYSHHFEEAWAFIQFLSSHEIQKLFAHQAGIAPSRAALFSDPELLAQAPQLRNHFEALQSATARPRTPLYPAVSHVLQRYFSRALAIETIDLAREAAMADTHIDHFLALTRKDP